MQKLDNVSVRQTYHWKTRFMGFFGDIGIFTFKIKVGVYEKLATTTSGYAATFSA